MGGREAWAGESSGLDFRAEESGARVGREEVTKDEEVEETSEVSGKKGQEEEDAKAGDVAITEVDMIGDCRVRQSAIEVREWPEEEEGEVMFPGKVVGVRTPVGED
jgi:hypothetical protein